MRRHKPPTWSWQVAPSASKLPLWGSENNEAVLNEVIVSVTSHKGSEITDLLLTDHRKMGRGTVSQQKVLHPRS